MIAIGNADITMAVGTAEVLAVYLGTEQVYGGSAISHTASNVAT